MISAHTIITIISIVLLSILLLWLCITQIKETMDSNDHVLRRLIRKLEPVHPIIGELSFYKDDQSYCINKEKIYICMQNEKGKYYTDNTLIYVILHEVAHVLCDEVGHTEKFQNIHQELIDKAAELGLYNPSIPIENNYCPKK